MFLGPATLVVLLGMLALIGAGAAILGLSMRAGGPPCAACGHRSRRGARFCGQCGRRLDAPP